MDITISFSTTPSTSVGPFTVTVRDVSNNATQTFTNVSRTQINNGYLIQNITSLDKSILVESSGTCNTSDVVDISSVTGGGVSHTGNALVDFGSTIFYSCNDNFQTTVYFDGPNNMVSLQVGDYLYSDTSGTPAGDGYYYKDTLTAGVFHVTGGQGQIAGISDCAGNMP